MYATISKTALENTRSQNRNIVQIADMENAFDAVIQKLAAIQ
jgi:hypothetical protein